MKIKNFTPLLLALALTACGEQTATTEEPQEEYQTSEEVETVEEPQDEVEVEKPYEETAKFAFGDNVETEVITIPDDNNNEKVTRVNVTYTTDVITSEKDAVDPFLIKVFSYLKKVKE